MTEPEPAESEAPGYAPGASRAEGYATSTWSPGRTFLVRRRKANV